MPEGVQALGSDIPELISGPLVDALPEFKNLARYGGATLEDNLKAASIRAKLLKKKLDEARLKAASSRESLGPDWLASRSTLSLGAEVSENDAQLLWAKALRNRDLNNTITSLLGRDQTLSSADSKNLAYLIQFLREDDPNISIDDMVGKALANGVTFTNDSGLIGRVKVPFKVENGIVSPAVDLTSYRGALTSMGDYANGHLLPNNISPNRVTLQIAATQKDFESFYRKISNTDRDLSGTQGVNFTLRSDGTETKRSQDLNGSIDDKTSYILINHEVNARSKPEFGVAGNDAIAETIYHEYAHTMHRSMGIGWGDASSANPGTAEYEAVHKQSISNYGDSNGAQEHFAETFAKFMATGSASPEFLDFLKNKVGIKEFTVDTVYPSIFRGSNMVKSFSDHMKSADLGGWTVSITGSGDNTISGKSDAELIKMAKQNSRSGLPRLVANFKGDVFDERGRKVGSFGRTVTRDSAGKISVSHDIFTLHDDAQGTGFGNLFTQEAFKLYKDEWNADNVKVHAALSNGWYIWAIQGFDFDDNYSRDQRPKYHTLAREAAISLDQYNANYKEYSAMSPAEVARDIHKKLAESGALSRFEYFNAEQISRLITAARSNGWNIDNNFINELLYVAKLNTRDVTSTMIAELGRRNKKTTDKHSSSFGRYVLSLSPNWYGIKVL